MTTKKYPKKYHVLCPTHMLVKYEVEATSPEHALANFLLARERCGLLKLPYEITHEWRDDQSNILDPIEVSSVAQPDEAGVVEEEEDIEVNTGYLQFLRTQGVAKKVEGDDDSDKLDDVPHEYCVEASLCMTQSVIARSPAEAKQMAVENGDWDFDYKLRICVDDVVAVTREEEADWEDYNGDHQPEDTEEATE